uniref:Uncharacterized protein n=1 Tax=Lotharella oceanica TaxID=641309 RepID=A0A7S2TMW5_9EUKA
MKTSLKTNVFQITAFETHEFSRLICALSHGTGYVIEELQPLVLDYVGADYLLSVGKVRREFINSALRFSVVFVVRNKLKQGASKVRATVVPVPRSGEAFVADIKKKMRDPNPSPRLLFPRRVLTF